mgnify:CR=1 FL=1
MKKEFIQELMNIMMFKKLTTVFSFLRKEKLETKDLEEAVKDLKRQGLYDAMKKSAQDPQEIADMALVAFDYSVKQARERYAASIKQMVEYYKTQNS